MNLTSGKTIEFSLSRILLTLPVILRYKCPNIRTTLVCPGHVYTAMFSTVVFPTFPLFSFFCPSLQPVTVVKKIIAALDDQHSQTILLPFYTNFIPYIGHLPSFLRDFVQWVSMPMLLGKRIILSHPGFQVSGADVAMNRFVKTSGRRLDEGPIDRKMD